MPVKPGRTVYDRRHEYSGLHRAAAVDRQHHAREECGFVVGQVNAGGRDIARLRQAPERHRRDEFLPVFGRVLFAHERLEQTGLAHHRGDAVDADPVGRQFDRERLRDEVHGSLGRIVPGQSRPRADPAGRADIDHAAAALPPHQRHDRIHHVKDRLHIDVEDLVELRLGQLEQRLVAKAPAGIVDDDIESAEPVGRDLHGSIDIGSFGDVAGHRDRRGAGFGRYLLDALGVEVEQHDLRTLAGEAPRDLGAVTGRRTRHQGRLSVQAHLNPPSRIPAASPGVGVSAPFRSCSSAAHRRICSVWGA